MRLLLDTQILLWSATDPERLGPARALIEGVDERLISSASTWELAIKQGIGKVDVGTDVRSWISRAVREMAADHLDITTDHAAGVEHLPPLHRDPFDRLLVAQATHEGAILLTGDRMLRGYGDVVQLIQDL